MHVTNKELITTIYKSPSLSLVMTLNKLGAMQYASDRNYVFLILTGCYNSLQQQPPCMYTRSHR